MNIQVEESKKKASNIASMSKSLFLANMTHELRTPLNVIVGFSELMAKEVYGKVQPEKYQEYIEAIYSSSQHLLELINDMLDLSKIEAQQMVLNIQDVDLKRLLMSVYKMLKNKFEQKNIEFNINIQENCELVIIDEKLFKQIFMNLFSNAIKYTSEHGKIEISSFSDDAGLNIWVKDNGIGMTEQEIELAMKPFGQAVNGENAHERGSGLGIPLVHTMVVLHGGDFIIESVKGEGTIMKIVLPIDRICQD